MALYDAAQEREYATLRANAGFHGIDLDKALGRMKPTKEAPVVDDNLVFKDPKEYEEMSEEEQNIMRDKMMEKFKAWAKNPMPTHDEDPSKRGRPVIHG